MSTRSLATDLRALSRRGIAAIKAAPAWLGGILTGAQAAFLSYLMVLAPTMAVVASAPTTSLSTGIDWGGSAGFASQLWLLGHGVPMSAGGFDITLLPLGLTLACGAILAAIARRFAARTWGSWALAVATYAVLVGGVASIAGGARAGTTSTAALAAAFAVALAAPSVAIGVWRAHGLELGWLSRIPEVARVGMRRAAGSMALIVCAAAIAQTAWAVMGRTSIGDASTALGLDGVGGVVLAVAELGYAPTLVAWMLAWLSGQGFSVGLGSAYAPDALTVGPLPGLPILGALPSAAGGLLVWAPLVILLIAAVVRVVTVRRSLSWRAQAAADAGAVLAISLVTAGICLLATGSAGPDRLASVGPDALPVAVAVGGLALAGMVLGTGVRLLIDLPLVRRMVARVAHRPAPAVPETRPAPQPQPQTVDVSREG